MLSTYRVPQIRRRGKRSASLVPKNAKSIDHHVQCILQPTWRPDPIRDLVLQLFNQVAFARRKAGNPNRFSCSSIHIGFGAARIVYTFLTFTMSTHASTASDGEDVNDFLRRIKELSDKRDQEDEERTRKLEEEILAGRRERQARRAGMVIYTRNTKWPGETRN